MRGRVLNREMVSWVNHLVQDTGWVPDRQAAADLLATIEHLLTAGELPGEAIVPPGLASPRALNSDGEVVSPDGAKPPRAGRSAKRVATSRPLLRLVPSDSAPSGEANGAGRGEEGISDGQR